MGNFVQANDHDVYMFTKSGCLDVYRFLYLNTSRFEL
jgi:hypothetical protein